MTTTIKCLLFALTLAMIQNSCFSNSLPAPVAAGLQRLESFYAERASTACRVQLMVIPPGIFVDPPPTAEQFPSRANVTIGVDAPTARNFVRLVIVDLRASKWREAPAPGYPRWYWRVVDSSGKVVVDLLIDEENAAIGCADGWYAVDRTLVNRLTREFVDFSTRQLLTSDVKIEPHEPTQAR